MAPTSSRQFELRSNLCDPSPFFIRMKMYKLIPLDELPPVKGRSLPMLLGFHPVLIQKLLRSFNPDNVIDFVCSQHLVAKSAGFFCVDTYRNWSGDVVSPL